MVAPDGRQAFIDHMARFAKDRRRARMLATECDWTIAPYAVEEVAKDVAGVADDIVATVSRLKGRRVA